MQLTPSQRNDLVNRAARVMRNLTDVWSSKPKIDMWSGVLGNTYDPIVSATIYDTTKHTKLEGMGARWQALAWRRESDAQGQFRDVILFRSEHEDPIICIIKLLQQALEL